jgi:hypothetical protein
MPARRCLFLGNNSCLGSSLFWLLNFFLQQVKNLLLNPVPVSVMSYSQRDRFHWMEAPIKFKTLCSYASGFRNGSADRNIIHGPIAKKGMACIQTSHIHTKNQQNFRNKRSPAKLLFPGGKMIHKYPYTPPPRCAIFHRFLPEFGRWGAVVFLRRIPGQASPRSSSHQECRKNRSV